MKIKKLHITNYKSIQDLVLENPNPFSVFVGPNGAGKSNIFEALEFAVAFRNTNSKGDVIKLFGGEKSIFPFNSNALLQQIVLETDLRELLNVGAQYAEIPDNGLRMVVGMQTTYKEEGSVEVQKQFKQMIEKFARVFLNNSSLKKVNSDDESSLNLDGSNLEKVLSRILKDKNKREDIIEWLQVLIPEFKDIQIETSSLSGDVSYVIYEKHSNKPFPKHLISDGTKNILALLTAVYQSDEPQFLCIEEPENGLHPNVIEELVSLFRTACKEKGHYIWLNTHSQTLVRQLTVDEIIVVDKKEGATRVRQFQGENLYGLKMDEAWLTNALGGGLI